MLSSIFTLVVLLTIGVYKLFKWLTPDSGSIKDAVATASDIIASSKEAFSSLEQELKKEEPKETKVQL